ncbi:uncharacterized protein LOC110708937 [Chenopodium quinoa]|uniref:uncharacterized protein LOC110708937 n=1 Tax=Chenopodium quinoa TaxID=63459 RepID=UPI000B780B53|nr:uncharacterized protein LOC110708937 [Chenopodium quinoa]
MRLKLILPGVVSENQSAFVPGRLITDNALIALEMFHTMKNRSKGKRGTIALQLDMSKAYDRVEWGFLRKLLLTMGFDGRWVNLVMQCVSTVRYSFVINGRVCGDVVPSRGLHQGDPLSPYLFILVADALSFMLQNRVQRGELHGARASRRGPTVSHLLFAYDSLLFARANRQECETIVDILNQYEVASGQKINYEKSEVSFSKGVRQEQKDEIMSALKMRQVDRHGKYLGIPTAAGRSKKAIFGALLDRIWKKLQGWKEKLFSRAGKETLLKAVIQAIPTYLMGVYKFPCSVIDKIASAMARFFWGQQGAQRKIHWQAWRLVHKEDSLLSKVMKAKYYPNCSFLDAALGYGGSYTWQSIWSAKALVKEGLIWRIGTGSQVNIWNDAWLADEHGSLVTTSENGGLSQVSELINFDNMEWNTELIASHFNERDQKCILSIPLSLRGPKDVLTWAFLMDGLYSTKTAYMLGKGCNFDDFHQVWREEESSAHAFFYCVRVQELWKDSGCLELFDVSVMNDPCEFLASWKRGSIKKQQRAAFLAWCIWGERNQKVFSDKTTPNPVLLARAIRLSEEYGLYSKKVHVSFAKSKTRSKNSWTAPPDGFIKINADASLSEDGWVGLGVVARDSAGSVAFAATRRSKAWWPPEIAEGKAICMAVRLAKSHGYKDVIIESDCQVLIDRLSKATTFFSDLDNVLEDVLYLSSFFNSCFWAHVKIGGNVAAHHLAKLRPFGVEQTWVNHVLMEISPYVFSDALSIR